VGERRQLLIRKRKKKSPRTLQSWKEERNSGKSKLRSLHHKNCHSVARGKKKEKRLPCVRTPGKSMVRLVERKLSPLPVLRRRIGET